MSPARASRFFLTFRFSEDPAELWVAAGGGERGLEQLKPFGLFARAQHRHATRHVVGDAVVEAQAAGGGHLGEGLERLVKAAELIKT